VDDGGEQRDLEQLGDEVRRSGQANVAIALAEVGGVADEQAHAGAIEAGDGGEVEHDAMELADDPVEGGCEGIQFFAEHDAAGALEDEDVPTKRSSIWRGIAAVLVGGGVRGGWKPRYHRGFGRRRGGQDCAGLSFGISSDVWCADQSSLRAVSRPFLVFLRRRR